jgi:hypothetical protein
MRMPYLPLAFCLFLSAFLLETTLLARRNHFITNQYFPSIFQLLLQAFTFQFLLFTLKICKFANFSVPL